MGEIDCPLFKPISIDECFSDLKNKQIQESSLDSSNCQTQWFYTSIPVKEDDPNLFYHGPSLSGISPKSYYNIDVEHKEVNDLIEISKNIMAQPIAFIPNQTKLLSEIKQKLLNDTNTYEQSFPSGSMVSNPASNSSSQKRSLISSIFPK